LDEGFLCCLRFRHAHDALRCGIRFALQGIIDCADFQARLDASAKQGATELRLMRQGVGYWHCMGAGWGRRFCFGVGFHGLILTPNRDKDLILLNRF
jgi:hypothetical protein